MNQHLAEGHEPEAIFPDTTDDYGFTLTVEKQALQQFRVQFDCQAGPTAGD